MSYRFTIYGDPVVQQRPRRGKHGNFYDPSTKEKIALAYELLASRIANRKALLTNDLSLDVSFFVKGNKRMDIDNLIKATFDAGNGVLWKDDSLIIDLVVRKVMNNDNPRTEIEIIEL